MQIIYRAGVVLGLVLTAVFGSGDESGMCETYQDIDIDPHTPGLGHVPGIDIATCCDTCTSPAWWGRGCRFYTLSKGNCWLKADNGSMVKTPGYLSGRALKAAPPPPPPPPPPPRGKTGDWIKVGPIGIGDDINASGEAGTLADAVSPASK